MTNLISCFTNNYGAYGVRAAVSSIRETGISALELALRGHNFGGLVIPEEAVVTEKADDATASAFVALLHQHEVRVSGCNIGGGDMRAPEGLELTIRRLEFAKKWFDVPVVITGAGHPTSEGELQAVLSNLRALGRVAESLDVTVALETHKGLTQNAEAMTRLLEQVDHPRIRLNFDTGNIAYYNKGMDPVSELGKVVTLVRNVHLKDNRGLFEDWYFPALGEGGAVDFAAIRETLDASGFQGACTIEIEGIQGEAEPGLKGRQERITKSVEHLRACGYLP